jgi:hypothetical protein
MYGTQKQQLRKLTKKEYLAIKEMCHLAKNMYNVGVYNVRQFFFEEGKYCNYYENNAWSKSNEKFEAEKMMKTVKQNPEKIQLPGSTKKHKPKVTADLRASA